VESVPLCSLQDVVSHSKKLTKKNKEQLSDMMMLNKQKGGMKALSKEKREKLEAYQHLFYLLQVCSCSCSPLVIDAYMYWNSLYLCTVVLRHYHSLWHWLLWIHALSNFSSCFRLTQHTWPSWFFRCLKTNPQSSWIRSSSRCITMHPIKERNICYCGFSKQRCRRRSSML